MKEYKRLYPPAEPREEFEDRVRLYSLCECFFCFFFQFLFPNFISISFSLVVQEEVEC